MEFLSESMEIGLESSWSISQWNPYGIPFNINGNWSGENPYGIPFKSLRSFQLQWDFVCRESWWNSLQNQWKLVWRALSQMGSLRNSLQYQWKLLWRAPGLCSYHMESLWDPFFNQWKLVWIAPGRFSHGLLKEFWSKSMEICLESNTFIWKCR